jgi:hypothetical protein
MKELIVADMDMKQKIKEVRDKFLSNNQIEDIRQNITLGVEERLKFLNSEQIKVVELLEEKHQELDIAMQLQKQQIDDHKEGIENTFEVKISDTTNQFEQKLMELKGQNEKVLAEQGELEKRIDEKFKNALKSQLAFIDDSLAQFETAQDQFKVHLKSMENNFSKKIEENNTQVTDLVNKNSSELTENNITLLQKFNDVETEVFNRVEAKLLSFEEENRTHLKEATEKFSTIASSLEKKIDSFLQNHKTVEEVIDDRLKEFRTAQKAAFEELEAALNLLEKHQDDTLTRFRQKSDLTSQQNHNRQTDLPNSLVKNRGSILYQSEELSKSSIPIDDDAIEATVSHSHSNKKTFKPIIMTFFASLIFIMVISSLNIDYNEFFNFSETFGR